MYRQQSLITLDEFYELKPLTKLEAILTFIDFTLFLEMYPESFSRRGPKGYSKKQLLMALIAMQVEQIPTIKALVHRLKSDPIFKRSLGFEYVSKTPSAATFTRFIKKLSETDILERTYRRMIYKANSIGLIDATNVAIDASKINAFEHAMPLKNIPKDDINFPNWGGKLDTNGNFIKWFGWKMHALVDTASGITLSYMITPANVADMDIAEPLIQKLKKDYEELFKPSYYLMDAGYDKPELYQVLYEKYNAQGIIPINWRNTQTPPEGINFEGQLVCAMNHPYVYGGNDNEAIRILCPHVCGKCSCEMGSNWCTSAASGYVGKVKIKDNPRFISSPFRGTESYKKLYNQRTSVERTFGDLKDNYGLDNLRVPTMKKAKVFMDICCIALLASRLSDAQKTQTVSA